ncbi:MAG TPA: ergothioneine biosynthesis protein EgtB [Acidobacteriaceae bacterium]|jgi:ergothioneine biosynthesis protein EgtB|nr:ergothioneine biosynthesis protein EgtB [Acidobacteriaceae bacterium]
MNVLTETALAEEFCRVRSRSLALCAPLTPEDMMVQSSADASPAKWHLAHTTWFFETFLLREFVPAYRPFHPDFIWLFNSYYNAVSAQPEKKLRASFSRPTADEILAYRHHVDAAMEDFTAGSPPEEAITRIILGLNHEQQHQELLITDVKNAFWNNPLHPVYVQGAESILGNRQGSPMRWLDFAGGLAEIGYQGHDFCFDNETPRHKVYLEPFRLASRPVSCAEYLAFMEDGGYSRSELWLAEGWNTVQTERWDAPLYWRRGETGAWQVFTLRGLLPLEDLLATPVCHISYFEADAFARWSGKSLPTEAEWEVATAGAPIRGNLLEAEKFHPQAGEDASQREQAAVQQLYGDVWEWTVSAYLPYPGYLPLPGALGEYNGKFMCNQMVLRGGSVATPSSHIRATYRNFFAPSTRWQFSGVRLAEH